MTGSQTPKTSHSDSAPEGPEWARSCGLCQNGLIDPPPATGGNLRDVRRTQMLNGELTFCDCAAGKAYRKVLGNLPFDMEREIATAKATAQEQRRQRLFDKSGVPLKFSTMTFRDYIAIASGKPGKSHIIAAVRNYVEHGAYWDGAKRWPGLYVWGEPGVGKTGALSPLFMDILRSGASGIWVQYNELMDAMRNFNGEESVHDRMHELQTCDVLFIDDLGDPGSTRVASDYARDVMFRLIDYRTNHFLPMFVTSNLSPAQLTQQLDERTARRLFDLCFVVHVSGAALGSTPSVEF